MLCPICNHHITTKSTNLRSYATFFCDKCHKFNSNIFTYLTFHDNGLSIVDKDDMQVYFNLTNMAFLIKFFTNEAYAYSVETQQSQLIFYKQFDNNQQSLNYILDLQNQIAKNKRLLTLL